LPHRRYSDHGDIIDAAASFEAIRTYADQRRCGRERVALPVTPCHACNEQ
jgi:hypothetical protein